MTITDQRSAAEPAGAQSNQPWHDANPGEVWVLSIAGTEYAVQITTDLQFHLLSGSEWFGIRDQSITAGRRIWSGVSA